MKKQKRTSRKSNGWDKLQALAEAGKGKHGARNWQAKLDEGELTQAVMDLCGRPPHPIYTPYQELIEEGCRSRITVVVAETLTYTKDGKPAKYKMETGRQMAQACHAVSGLKLLYSVWQSQNGFASRAYSINDFLTKVGITTICLKARDSQELEHIRNLAESRGLLHYGFADDNKTVYGVDHRILSAVAIGPVTPDRLVGVTDYLPLWQDPT